jgi:Amidohydrolase family
VNRRRRASTFLLCVIGLASTGLAQTLIFEHATVIDATGAAPKNNFTVVVRDGRIASVASRAETRRAQAESETESGARVIDATGKYLIPGLWDMHVHITAPEIVFPLLLANGITGVREMYSGFSLATVRQWKQFPDAPRMYAPGFIDGPLMGGAGKLPDAIAVSNAEQARLAVRFLQAEGADFLKVYNSVPRDAFLALADEARAAGMPIAGHVPEEVSPIEASDEGIRSEEHLNNLLLAASTNEADLRAERVATMYSQQITGEQRLRLLAWPMLGGLVDTYDEEKAAAMFRVFVKNETRQTPTLSILWGFAHELDSEFVNDPRMRYVPKTWSVNWDPRVIFYLRAQSPAEYEVLHQRMRMLLTRYRKLVGDMNRAGVELLAGTDMNPFNPVLPGWGLHNELVLLQESGLTPMQALQTATRNPARYFGILNETGTIEAGKSADLVLLDADPLADIQNTQKIAAVVSRGRYYSRQDLDAMLEHTAALSATVH